MPERASISMLRFSLLNLDDICSGSRTKRFNGQG